MQMNYRQKLTAHDLPPIPHFYREDYLEGDFEQGTLTTSLGTRVIVLPSELMLGLHEALEYEAGRAWAIVCYSCGKNWGARLMQMMQAEWREHYRQQLEHMDFEIFQGWINEFFQFNGWGDLEIDFGLESKGLVQFYMKDSILEKILETFEAPYVNEIFAGVIAAMVCWLSGRDLDALEIGSKRLGAERSRIVVGLPERIERGRRARAAEEAREDDILAAMLADDGE